MRSPASSFMSALNQVARLAGTVVQRALRSHLFLVQRSHQPGFVEKELPGGYVFNDNRNIETHPLGINVISHCVHRDSKTFVHERIFHRLSPLIGRSQYEPDHLPVSFLPIFFDPGGQVPVFETGTCVVWKARTWYDLR